MFLCECLAQVNVYRRPNLLYRITTLQVAVDEDDFRMRWNAGQIKIETREDQLDCFPADLGMTVVHTACIVRWFTQVETGEADLFRDSVPEAKDFRMNVA